MYLLNSVGAMQLWGYKQVHVSFATLIQKICGEAPNYMLALWYVVIICPPDLNSIGLTYLLKKLKRHIFHVLSIPLWLQRIAVLLL